MTFCCRVVSVRVVSAALDEVGLVISALTVMMGCCLISWEDLVVVERFTGMPSPVVSVTCGVSLLTWLGFIPSLFVRLSGVAVFFSLALAALVVHVRLSGVAVFLSLASCAGGVVASLVWRADLCVTRTPNSFVWITVVVSFA